MKGYDNISVNEDIVLDLPFYEGTGTVTRDQSVVHHQDVLLINTPTWEQITGGLGVLSFDNTSSEYIELDNASCTDLDFTSGDYSLGCWIRLESVGATFTAVIMGRYETYVGGWWLYISFRSGAGTLTLSHNHAGTIVGVLPASSFVSAGWATEIGKWSFIGVSRTGEDAQHYRNGVPLLMTSPSGGLVDPETCGSDLVIGASYTKDAFFYKGKMWRPRIWDRVVTADEWLHIFETERNLFGV